MEFPRLLTQHSNPSLNSVLTIRFWNLLNICGENICQKLKHLNARGKMRAVTLSTAMEAGNICCPDTVWMLSVRQFVLSDAASISVCLHITLLSHKKLAQCGLAKRSMVIHLTPRVGRGTLC